MFHVLWESAYQLRTLSLSSLGLQFLTRDSLVVKRRKARLSIIPFRPIIKVRMGKRATENMPLESGV